MFIVFKHLYLHVTAISVSFVGQAVTGMSHDYGSSSCVPYMDYTVHRVPSGCWYGLNTVHQSIQRSKITWTHLGINSINIILVYRNMM